MQYKYAVYHSNGYNDTFRPFIELDEAISYYNKLEDYGEAILLNYLDGKQEESE